MGRIPQHFIDELIARADIVEIIGGRVPLKKAGPRIPGLLPVPQREDALLLGQPGQAVLSLLRLRRARHRARLPDGTRPLPFPEAVEELATRLGLEVPHEGGTASGPKRADEPLYELMEDVARFYCDMLAREPARASTSPRRGLEPATLERFSIGYAPDSWNEVLRRFGGTEAARKALLDGGLIIERERGQMRDGERHYDRFRDRIMFPIRDARGRVIAFGGRVLDAGEPKYLNSPETVLFHKGRELYGLYETRRARTNLSRLLVVEGYMDTVRLHQAGIDYAVATLGTATTPEHLRRAVSPGQRGGVLPSTATAPDARGGLAGAAERAARGARGPRDPLPVPARGQDPDTLVGEEGREAFEARLQRRGAAVRIPRARAVAAERAVRMRTGGHALPRTRARCS